MIKRRIEVVPEFHKAAFSPEIVAYILRVINFHVVAIESAFKISKSIQVFPHKKNT